MIGNPHEDAMMTLMPTAENPNPRYVWDRTTVMPSDLVKKQGKGKDNNE